MESLSEYGRRHAPRHRFYQQNSHEGEAILAIVGVCEVE
jgi:hypothetical protein